MATPNPGWSAATTPRTHGPEAIESAEDEIVEEKLRISGSLYTVLTETNRHLEAIAETGMQTGIPAHREWLSKSRQEVHGFGLTALASALNSLSKGVSSPQAIVKARYLTHLYSQATKHLG